MRCVADIMTRDLFPLKANQTLNVVRLLMRTVQVRHVPILDDEEHFVGLLSHRDLLAYSISKLADINPIEQRELDRHIPIKDVMRTEIATTTPATDLKEAISSMLENKFGCLPVIDNQKNLVGIITDEDIIRLAIKLLEKEEKEEASSLTPVEN
ncbi:MAG: CBS domain-containing protein [Deltaproteobacteria bacterium]|nr:CBS domain-containing protein [Deltaproteobacteria bacterium]